jgi:hypothetical protein
VQEIRDVLTEQFPHTAISDLHMWRGCKGRHTCILALVSGAPLAADDVRRQRAIHEELVHVTVEVIQIAWGDPKRTVLLLIR